MVFILQHFTTFFNMLCINLKNFYIEFFVLNKYKITLLLTWFLFAATPATKKKIDKHRLNELDSSTLVDLIKDYMLENQELRRENNDLFSVRDMMLRDQELVCRENERLLKKLEDVNSWVYFYFESNLFKI